MVAELEFDAGVVFDPSTNQILRAAVGVVVASNGSEQPVQIYDWNGSPISSLVSSEAGFLPRFRTDDTGNIAAHLPYVKFGAYYHPVQSRQSMAAGITSQAVAAQAAAAATSAVAQAAQSATAAQVSADAAIAAAEGSGGGGGSDGGVDAAAVNVIIGEYINAGPGVPFDKVSDASPVGRAVGRAADAAAARTAIGAGTSNLTIGTTGITAKAGNYVPTVAEISDAGAAGKAVLAASTQSAGRAAIAAASALDVLYLAAGDDSNLTAALASAPADRPWVAVKVAGS